VKVGDLISFKPIGFGDDDWSNPGIVLREWEHLDRNKKPMWIVWCDGFEIIMDEINYEISHLARKRA
jgi:hypothetical protein